MREEIKNVDANVCPYCGHKLRWDIGQILIRRWPNNIGTNQIRIEGYYKDINGRLGYIVRHLGGYNGLYEDDSKTYVTTEYALALDNYEPTEKQKYHVGKEELGQ